MKLNRWTRTAAIFGAPVVGAGIIALLVAMSEVLIHRDNGFVRLFPTYPITPSDTVRLPYNSYYFAGEFGGTLYLGNRSGALHVLSLSLADHDTTHHVINIPGLDTMRFWGPTLRIDSSAFYLMDGTQSKVFRGSVATWSGSLWKHGTAFFTEAIPYPPGSLAMRSKSASTREFVLGKLDGSDKVTLSETLLQKQVDGVFCTDGEIHYSHRLNRLIYIYFYRNQFIVADTSLNLDYRGKTIDTTTVAKVKVTETSKGRTLAAPPLTVNKSSFGAGLYLFVHSGLMATNEDAELFERSAAIDIYDVSRNGRYVFSLYLPKYDGQKLTDFVVHNSQVIALFEDTVVCFNLKSSYLML
jgi:hypothetical protein